MPAEELQGFTSQQLSQQLRDLRLPQAGSKEDRIRRIIDFQVHPVCSAAILCQSLHGCWKPKAVATAYTASLGSGCRLALTVGAAAGQSILQQG